MSDKSKALDDLRREVSRIAQGKGAWQDMTKPTDFRAFTPAPKDARLRQMGRVEEPAARGPFGQWLLRQSATGPLAQLVKAAKADPLFPSSGDPEAVRARLRACQAEGDMFAAIDDAEVDWLSY